MELSKIAPIRDATKACPQKLFFSFFLFFPRIRLRESEAVNKSRFLVFIRTRRSLKGKQRVCEEANATM